MQNKYNKFNNLKKERKIQTNKQQTKIEYNKFKQRK